MVERTKKNILDAFNRLIPKYNFDSITVSMITEEAGISKATFYRYFKDKYEVMNYNYKLLLDYYVSPERCHNYKDLYFYLFKVAKESWRYLRHAFESTGINSFGYYIYEYSYETARQITMQNRSGKGFTPTEQLQCDVFCQGISHMYENWILGKYSISAEEAAEALYSMMPETLKHYWWTDIDKKQE